MRISFGTNIINQAGEKVAELHQVVVDPKTDQVTHLVGKKGFLFPTDKVIPISLVMSSDEEQIKLYDFQGSYDDLDDFIELQFVKAEIDRPGALTGDDDERISPLIAYPPAGQIGMSYTPVITQYEDSKIERVKNIPEETTNIPKDARVIGLNGEHVGNVEEVIINPDSDQMTHFVISKGLFFSEEKLVPASWVSGFASGQLKLVVNEKIIETLPEYKR